MKIGEKIKEVRTRLGLQEKSLAYILGVNKVLYCNWEKNIEVPSRENIYPLAKAINMSTDKFISCDKLPEEINLKTYLKQGRYSMDKKGAVALLQDYYPRGFEIYELILGSNNNYTSAKVKNYFKGIVLAGNNGSALNYMERMAADENNDLTGYYLLYSKNVKLYVHVYDEEKGNNDFDNILEIDELPKKTKVKTFKHNDETFKIGKRIIFED